MEWWHSIVLGLVEGITEYLPISSTGHLILTSSLLKLDSPEKLKKAVDAFDIVVQGGAILAVAGLYWPRIVQMARGVFGNDRDGLRLLVNLFIAFLPAAVTGLLLKKWIETHLFFAGPVIFALFAGGVFMMVLEAWRRGRFGVRPMHEHGVEALTARQALVIGCMQCVAMWPGTSRSMMTIGGGYVAGLRPAAAAEFSFLLGLPTLGAACLYTLYKNLKESGEPGHESMFTLLGTGNTVLGIVVATISAAVAVKWLVGFLSRRGLTPFGWYRIGLCLVLLVLAWQDLLRVSPK